MSFANFLGSNAKSGKTEFDLGDIEIDFDNVEVETLDVKQQLKAPEITELQTTNATLQQELFMMKQTIDELKEQLEVMKQVWSIDVETRTMSTLFDVSFQGNFEHS